jgi:thiol-disulfide isomerase/thioredoxin
MILILSLTIGCSSGPQTKEVEKDFAAYDLDGNQVRLSDYRGKIVVLNFWALWCGPCLLEMPHLDAIQREYHDRDVVVLAVNVSESASDITAYAQEYNLSFPILRDTELEAARTYGIRSLPTTFFIDREGLIHCYDEGGREHCAHVGARSEGFFADHIESIL